MQGFDLSAISNCYVGGTPASAIYIGSVQIWPSTPPPHDYSRDYLTFEALESTTFTFSQNDLQYSLDDGTTWTTLTAGTASPTITTGNKILWKQTGLTPSSSNPWGLGTFSATGNFDTSGNIMSLYYGDNFIGQTDLTGKSNAFYRLFYSCSKLISAENLILSATILSQYCYAHMFYGCTSLASAPELPATTLAESCYENMFYGCTSLATVPNVLPATTLADYCYNEMFYGCTLLASAPELPATTLAYGCYNQMFNGCTNLNYIKCLAIYGTINSYTYYWLNGVAATGTFIKNASMTSWTIGSSGIPADWTTVNNT